MERDLNVPIILASTSPRRIDLLKQAGLKVLVIVPNADESQKRGESPREMVTRLACLKAEAVVPEVMRKHGGGLIIAADTTVVAPDGRKVLGKPRDPAEARRML